MGWRDRDDNDDYADDIDVRLRGAAAQGGAGLGLASAGISVVSGVGAVIMVILAAVLTDQQNGQVADDDPKMIVVGLGILGFLLLAVIGVVLGFVGISQSNTTGTISGVLGVIFNGLIVLGVGALICAGLAIG